MAGSNPEQPPLQTPSNGPAVRLGAWNYYFLAKFLLVWRELIGFHPLENLAFAAVLLAPIQSPRLRLLRHIAAIPAAVALLYYDSWLPPLPVSPFSFSRLLSQANLLTHFSPAYLVELIGRFVNGPVVVALVLLWALYALAARYVRVGVPVMAVLLSMLLFQGSGKAPSAAGVGAMAATHSAPDSPDTALQAFYAGESKRGVKFARLADGALPFDVFFIHICSLSWDDLEATGLTSHPLWRDFDIVFQRFNTAASYSGPAAIRILRAPCGQPPHATLYAPVPEHCYLMPALKQAGFDTHLLLNHDGHFDDFLGFVHQQGIAADPLPLNDLPVPLRAFDDTAIHDDGAVLSRWLERRAASPAPHVAAYYNTISLHDGNRLVADPKLGSLESYKIRLTKLLDDLDGFMQNIARHGRRAIVVFIPEHGAALRGDKAQIAGLREIPSPAITLVPVGVKVIGVDAHRIGQQVRVSEAASYLALSHIVARMLEKPPFDATGFAPADYLAGLPPTGFVAENDESIMIRHDNRYLLRSGSHAAWKEYAVGE